MSQINGGGQVNQNTNNRFVAGSILTEPISNLCNTFHEIFNCQDFFHCSF
jgi:hypothetical protein